MSSDSCEHEDDSQVPRPTQSASALAAARLTTERAGLVRVGGTETTLLVVTADVPVCERSRRLACPALRQDIAPAERRDTII